MSLDMTCEYEVGYVDGFSLNMAVKKRTVIVSKRYHFQDVIQANQYSMNATCAEGREVGNQSLQHIVTSPVIKWAV